MKVKGIPAIALAALLAGCGGDPEPRAVPDVRGERLDVAERRLDRLGLAYERVGGGALGIVVRSNWRVCEQRPAPGREAVEVVLVVDRHCPPPPPPTHVVPDVRGEELVDAEEELAGRRIPFERRSAFGEQPIGGLWVVCRQRPEPGKRAARVVLYAAPDCDEPRPAPIVPDVRFEDVDDAQDQLAGRGIGSRVLPAGLTVDERLTWQVCEQEPDAGQRGAEVVLVARAAC